MVSGPCPALIEVVPGVLLTLLRKLCFPAILQDAPGASGVMIVTLCCRAVCGAELQAESMKLIASNDLHFLLCIGFFSVDGRKE